MQIELKKTWTTGDLLGGGGFGRVYKATAEDGETAVIKLVPKAPGGQRELLFVDLGNATNVVPIIDSGDTDSDWALVMPQADKSLRDHMASINRALSVEEAKPILLDIIEALVSLEQNGVVHRDIKPENVLLLNGKWCLADFGISRYAEATTAPDTHKFALTAAYAAPERWRNVRATTATDIYAVGIIAFELLDGKKPFQGPEVEDYREQHLHADPPTLEQVTTRLSALIDECLNKAPAARPSPTQVKNRLDRVSAPARSEGLTRLEEANRVEVTRQAEAARRDSEAQTAAALRADVLNAAKRSYLRLSEELKDAIVEAAPTATVRPGTEGSWTIKLGQAELTLDPFTEIAPHVLWQGMSLTPLPAIDVLAITSIDLKMPANQFGYTGRSHSIWYCDVKEEGQYGWFETAFMVSPMVRMTHGSQNPWAAWPRGEEAGKALWRGMAEYQLAWPFTLLQDDELDEFISRWAEWLAAASTTNLNQPGTMPERPIDQGSFRT
jgi:serine/threonine-protein kinase